MDSQTWWTISNIAQQIKEIYKSKKSKSVLIIVILVIGQAMSLYRYLRQSGVKLTSISDEFNDVKL